MATNNTESVSKEDLTKIAADIDRNSELILKIMRLRQESDATSSDFKSKDARLLKLLHNRLLKLSRWADKTPDIQYSLPLLRPAKKSQQDTTKLAKSKK